MKTLIIWILFNASTASAPSATVEQFKSLDDCRTTLINRHFEQPKAELMCKPVELPAKS